MDESGLKREDEFLKDAAFVTIKDINTHNACAFVTYECCAYEKFQREIISISN